VDNQTNPLKQKINSEFRIPNSELNRTWAEVSLDALAHNLLEVRRLIRPSRLMAVVKADAYGHGAVAVARLFREYRVDYLAVASVDEAMELRRAGIPTPILIQGFTPPELTPLLIEHNLTQVIFDSDMAGHMSYAAAGCSRPLRVHLKVDTGMSRLGLVWRGEETLTELLRLCRLPHLEYEGLSTHFATSETVGDTFTQKQLADFTFVRDALGRAGIQFPICHCANSGAVIQYKGSHCDMTRAGLILYGLIPGTDLPFDGQPAMTLYSVISQVKDIEAGATISYGRTFTAKGPMRIAVVAIGYADGYSRALSNKAHVLVGGYRAPIVGVVCMDMLVVDVTGIPEAHAGDRVILFGSGQGDAISAAELAGLAGTIPYEIVCAVGRRVPRVYLRGGREVGRTNYLLGDEEYVTRWPV